MSHHHTYFKAGQSVRVQGGNGDLLLDDACRICRSELQQTANKCSTFGGGQGDSLRSVRSKQTIAVARFNQLGETCISRTLGLLGSSRPASPAWWKRASYSAAAGAAVGRRG